MWSSSFRDFGNFVLTLNISKAFGRMWHKSLLSKLPSFGFAASFYSVIKFPLRIVRLSSHQWSNFPLHPINSLFLMVFCYHQLSFFSQYMIISLLILTLFALMLMIPLYILQLTFPPLLPLVLISFAFWIIFPWTEEAVTLWSLIKPKCHFSLYHFPIVICSPLLCCQRCNSTL